VHKIIDEDGILLMPGVFDAMSGKLLADAGLKAAFVSGYAVRHCAACPQLPLHSTHNANV
jgi:2-methylisocitrate lyase-like PEP mutase family enzyme